MVRKTFAVASAVSLILFVGAVVLWVRSWRTFDVFTYHRTRLYQAVSEEGRIRVQRFSVVVRLQTITMQAVLGSNTFVTVPLSNATEQPLAYDESHFARLNREFGQDRLWAIRKWRSRLPRSTWPRGDAVSFATASEADFTVVQHRRQEWVVGRVLQVPYWLVVATALLLPVWYTLKMCRRVIRFQRVHRGLCRECSYDLTGNTSGVCPECGAAVVRDTPADPPGA